MLGWSVDSWFAILCASVVVASVFGVLLPFLCLWWNTRSLPGPTKGTVAFFHPFADGGGGGERVLWCAVKALQDAYPGINVAIYVREGVDSAALVRDASSRFNVDISRPVQVVPLAQSSLVQPERYRSLTLVRQAFGSVRLTHEALTKLVPQVFVDTTGWAFGYPLAWMAGCKVVCYVHYPTISSNMLLRVWRGAATYNNHPDIAGSLLKTLLKSAYYSLVALVYGCCGAFSHVTMVNSRWTQGHIQRVWFASRPPNLVYPPVDTSDLQHLPLDRKLKQLFLVSVNQFRPEKNHVLQLQAFALAKQKAGAHPKADVVHMAKLKMVGGCRHADDHQRLARLQAYAQELGLGESVDWVTNAPYAQLRALLGEAVGGLHTMVDEHFGISVVEYMAAGVIPIAHNSGGPAMDIVLPEDTADGPPQITGFLADNVEEYASAITQVLTMDQKDRLRIAAAAQLHASRFSTERFMESFLSSVAPVLHWG